MATTHIAAYGAFFTGFWFPFSHVFNIVISKLMVAPCSSVLYVHRLEPDEFLSGRCFISSSSCPPATTSVGCAPASTGSKRAFTLHHSTPSSSEKARVGRKAPSPRHDPCAPGALVLHRPTPAQIEVL